MTLWTLHRMPETGDLNGVIRDERGAAVAHVTDANPFDTDPAERVDPDRGLPVVVRTGWIGGEADPGRGVFTSGFETWSSAGAAAFAALAARLSEAGRLERVWFRPHASHALSDVQTIFNAVKDEGALAAGRVLVEPAALLTHSMIEAAEDHLARAAETLFDRPQTVGVMIGNVMVAEPAGGDTPPPSGPPLRPAPLGEGLLDHEVLSRLARAAAGVGKPVVVAADDADAARATLGL